MPVCSKLDGRFGSRRARSCERSWLPAALPGVLVGARLSMTLALVLAIVAEMVGNPAGLGYAVVREQQAMRPELVFAYVVVIGALGVILNAALTGAVAVLFPAASVGCARRADGSPAEQPGDRRTAAFRACEPSARARMLPLIVLLLVWQMLQPGPSPYFPGPLQWWTATVTMFGANISSPPSGDDLDLPRGPPAGDRRRHGSRPAGRDIGPRRARAAAAARIHARDPAARDGSGRLTPDRYSESMKLTVVVLSALWPILLNATSAVRQIDPLLLDVARSFRLTACSACGGSSSGDRAVAAAWDPHRDPASHRGDAPGRDAHVLPGSGADDSSQRNFQSSEVYALLRAGGLFGFVVNDLFAVIEGVIMPAGHRGPEFNAERVNMEVGFFFWPYTLDLCEKLAERADRYGYVMIGIADTPGNAMDPWVSAAMVARASRRTRSRSASPIC